MALTSDDVNYLVYRYLLESGLKHTAFTFAHETRVVDSDIRHDDVAPGAMIMLLQKGLQYVEMEANLNDDGSQVGQNFEVISSRELITTDIEHLRGIVKGRAEESRKEALKRAKDERKASTRMDTDEPEVVPQDDVTLLQGHTHSIFTCAWNPVEPLIASGSGDATARIWNATPGQEMCDPLVLRHGSAVLPGRSRDVTTLSWSPDGSLLASGAYDGNAHIWSKEGEQLRVLKQHSAPIFSLKWNKKGDTLISGSVDKTVVAWDAKSGHMRQQFAIHSGVVLDVDWKSDTIFASSSTDQSIAVCRLGEEKPLKVFEGHDDEINTISWSPSGRILASGSDDKTTKLWMLQGGLRQDLQGHEAGVYTLAWAPCGPGSANPGRRPQLATASFDWTVRLWDTETGSCQHTLRRHSKPVCTVCFSPCGSYVASGSFDNFVYVWSAADGQLLKSYEADAGVLQVAWSADGSRLAGCCADHTLRLLDLRM